jgi:hypothetical protein
VPAGSVRPRGEALEDPQLKARGACHRHAGAADVEGAFTASMGSGGGYADRLPSRHS